MSAMFAGFVAAIGIAFGSHYLLTERPDLVEQYVPGLSVPGSAGEAYSSKNVRL